MTLCPSVLTRVQQRVGTMLRRKYRLDALLGVGGAGAVYAATHRNGTCVAIKILHPELAVRADMRARFLREGYVANKIQHRGVVRLLDDDDAEEEKTVFLVMELLHGESLEARWERRGRSLPLAETLRYVDDILDILAAAHEQGVVHRDVKPDNVFLTNEGALKILDFGIARLLDGSGATRSGEVFGTPAFMPPEQATGRVREIDARTDLWSVAAVTFTLLSGEYVHEATSATLQMIFAGTQPARAMASVLSTIPPLVASVVDRALAFRPADRFSSAREMQHALRATAVYSSTSPSVPAHGSAAQGLPTLPPEREAAVIASSQRTLLQGGAAPLDESEGEPVLALRRR